jgi:CoA:oxalate CoA-transferase
MALYGPEPVDTGAAGGIPLERCETRPATEVHRANTTTNQHIADQRVVFILVTCKSFESVDIVAARLYESRALLQPELNVTPARARQWPESGVIDVFGLTVQPRKSRETEEALVHFLPRLRSRGDPATDMPDSSEEKVLSRPLEGLTVLDMTIALAGPFATFLLAGLGARVIKLENPIDGDPCRSNAPYLGVDGATLTKRHADDISISALNRLRGKLGITLNLKHQRAREILTDLVRRADILVENFSRGTLERLGAGYNQCKEINPRIVYCSISGFGGEGEAGSGKAMDTIIQALSGFMLISGRVADPPIRFGLPLADLCAPLFGVIGILAALRHLERTGKGQNVDVSMLGVLTMMLASEPYDILERCGIPQRTGDTVPRLAPMGIYPTQNGYVAICAPTQAFAKALFEAMEKPEWITDPRFATRDSRVRNVDELDTLVRRFTSSMPTHELLHRLEQSGVPAAEVRDPATALRDPQVTARHETVPLVHPKYGAVDDVIGMGIPIKFSNTTAGLDDSAPLLGEHNDFVYGKILGYTEEKIKELRLHKVI